jgi:hypothetical protein
LVAIGHVTVASRKQIVAPISFYCHDKFCSFISLFLVAIKNSLAHLTYEDRKISKLNCFVLTKLKIKNRIGPAHRRLRRGEKTWEGKKGRLPSLRGEVLFVSSVAPLVRPGDDVPLLRQGDGDGFAAAARWQIRPPPSGSYPQLVRPPRAPTTPAPAPRHCLRTKVSRQHFFWQ